MNFLGSNTENGGGGGGGDPGTIDDASTNLTTCWSGQKVSTQLSTKATVSHTHTKSQISDLDTIPYDTHIGDDTKHRVINDAGTSSTDLWSASKITDELALVGGGSGITAGDQAVLDKLSVVAGPGLDFMELTNVEALRVKGIQPQSGNLYIESPADISIYSADNIFIASTDIQINQGQPVLLNNVKAYGAGAVSIKSNDELNEIKIENTGMGLTTTTGDIDIKSGANLILDAGSTILSNGALQALAGQPLALSSDTYVSMTAPLVNVYSDVQVYGDLNINGVITNEVVEMKIVRARVSETLSLKSNNDLGKINITNSAIDIVSDNIILNTTNTDCLGDLSIIGEIKKSFGTLTMTAPTLNITSTIATNITSPLTTISGDLQVDGDFITTTASQLIIEDPLIKLADGNTASDVKAIGLYGESKVGAIVVYNGIVRHPNNGFYLFDNKVSEPITGLTITADPDADILSDAKASTFTCGNCRCLSTTQPNLMPKLTTSTRDALTPTQGQIMFNSLSKRLEYYDGIEWRAISSVNGTGNCITAPFTHGLTLTNYAYYGNGTYSHDSDKIYFPPDTISSSAIWHYINTRTQTLVAWTHGLGASYFPALGFSGVYYHSAGRRAYLVPNVPLNATTIWYIDDSKMPPTLGSIATTGLTNGYFGAVPAVVGGENRLYFVGGAQQASGAVLHYINLDTDTAYTYTNTVVGTLSGTMPYRGGALNPNLNRIYLSPYSQGTQTQWHYIDTSDNSIQPYTHGMTVVATPYSGAVYHEDLDRIYFVPGSQANQTVWHYIDSSGNAQPYNHNTTVTVANAYINGVYHSGEIHFAPYYQSQYSFFHKVLNDGTIQEYQNSVSNFSHGYAGFVSDPHNGKIWGVPYNASDEANWLTIVC